MSRRKSPDDGQTVKKPEAIPPPLYPRGSWTHERDGDLNPTWIFVTGYLVLGVGVCIAAVKTGNPIAIAAALGFLTTVILALLMTAAPVSKAKILARARLAAVAKEAETEGGE